MVFPYRDFIVFLWLLSRFFVFSFRKFNYDVYWHGFLGFILFSFLNLYVDVFHQIWQVFSHYFFKCSFILPSFPSAFLDSSDMNVGYFVMSPQVPEALVTFSQSLFCYSDWVNSVVLSWCSLIHHLHSTVSPSSKSLISIF